MDAHTLAPASSLAKHAKTPFPGESTEYRKARAALLAEEIEFRRHMTRLTDQRRALPPGPVIEKNYRFKDANGAELGLIDLFGKHDALVTYFWMFGPQRERPCPMCTNWLGAVNGNAADIKQRVAFKVLGRSPVPRQIAFAQERGWRDLDFRADGRRRLRQGHRRAEGRRFGMARDHRIQARRRQGAPVLGERNDRRRWPIRARTRATHPTSLRYGRSWI